MAALAARWRHHLHEHEVSDDWRERRIAEYRRQVIGGRLVVRPEWAPAADPGMIDLALSDDIAFGSGAHPSTHAILLTLLEVTPLGSFADLGCGSGVLGILAAKLGWAPVSGLEIIEPSVISARANARRNGVEMDGLGGRSHRVLAACRRRASRRTSPARCTSGVEGARAAGGRAGESSAASVRIVSARSPRRTRRRGWRSQSAARSTGGA